MKELLAAILILALAFSLLTALRAREDLAELRDDLRPVVCSIIVYEDGSAAFDPDDALRAECLYQRLAP